ncbi:uncharacterized protein ALTATR162_LOCUS2221 [Alternaria atra]|uniref:Uncharacterized protein n=1 Tax=Alternaria atra TaxID=119953 RepID=A0A8J2HX95_9PLEO|nr:uncharacterized protein ALTATR162_LOCUS2221 [Alternaria atra]CAG5148592.1 unnamed protein product [Alternaria atra]
MRMAFSVNIMRSAKDTKRSGHARNESGLAVALPLERLCVAAGCPDSDRHRKLPKKHNMAFEWLAPILTPAALRSVQADGRPVITLFLVIFGLSVFGVLIWYVHFVTSKMYPKKKDPNAKKGPLLGFIKR